MLADCPNVNPYWPLGVVFFLLFGRLNLTNDEMQNCQWLEPRLVAQIDFTEWTPNSHLRHSKFVGLREDKEAGGVVREPGS